MSQVNTATPLQKYENNLVISCLNIVSRHGIASNSNIKSVYLLRHICRSVFIGGIFFTLNQPVSAVTKLDHTFTPYVGSSHIYDSNLLRAPDDNNLERNTDGTVVDDQKRIKDSFIHQIRAGLNVDWRYSRQQFIVKGEVNQNWFTAFSQLDYLGHDVLAQWNWVAGSRLKGEIGYKHNEALSSFAQLGGRLDQILKNLQTGQEYFANAEYEILPSIYLKAGFLRNEWNFGEDRQNSNQTQNIGEFRVQYRNLSKTMVGFRAVITDGQYPNRPANDASDNAFFRTSYHLDGEWKYSDKLRVGGSVGYVQQDYQHVSILNFSDVVARFDLNWIPSEKTTLAFSAWREVDQAFTQNATFVLSTGVRVTPSWIPTQKIRFEMPLSFENQDYLGDVPNATGTRQSDEVVDLGLNLIYAPWLNTEFALNVKHEERSSNIGERSYEAQSVGISAKVEF